MLIKFDDNANDLVDFVVGADGIFSNTRSFFEKKINKPIFKKAIALRTIITSNSELDIDRSKISLMMGSNCHLVIYPINKNKDLNFVCIVRNKNYDPNNIQFLAEKVIRQNPNLKKKSPQRKKWQKKRKN